jgi:hypothetical protein
MTPAREARTRRSPTRRRPTGAGSSTTGAPAVQPGNQATSTPTTTDARWGHFTPWRRGQCKPSLSLALDQHLSVLQRPDHLATHQRMASEGPEAVPDRSFKGVPSSSHTAGRHTSSERAGPRRAAWIPEASLPVGVEHLSPGCTCTSGRSVHATPERCAYAPAGTARERPLRPHRQRLHRAPGAAPHSGHHCPSQACRSLMPPSKWRGSTTAGRLAPRGSALRGGREPAARPARAALVVTVLVTAVLSRADLRWLAVTKPKPRRA